MKKDQTVNLLKSLRATVPNHQPRTGWVVSNCPLGPWRHDGGKSSPTVFGVRLETGDARCNCFSCGWHGRLSDLVFDMRVFNRLDKKLEGVDWYAASQVVELAQEEFDIVLDSPDIEEVLFGEKTGPHVFPQWWLDSFPKWSDVAFAREYIRTGREGCDPVPDELADALDLRADTHERRVCFPVRDFKGQLVGLHGRAVESGVNPRYRMYLQGGKNNPIHWLGESWVELDQPIVVVEGPFDLASVARVYGNVVSPLFANPSFEKLYRMAPALEWITLFDRGTGGDAGRAKVSKAMQKDHVVHHLTPPDGCKDPGMMSVNQLRETLLQVLPESALVVD